MTVITAYFEFMEIGKLLSTGREEEAKELIRSCLENQRFFPYYDSYCPAFKEYLEDGDLEKLNKKVFETKLKLPHVIVVGVA